MVRFMSFRARCVWLSAIASVTSFERAALAQTPAPDASTPTSLPAGEATTTGAAPPTAPPPPAAVVAVAPPQVEAAPPHLKRGREAGGAVRLR